MRSPRQEVCGAGLHDLTDPANVGLSRRAGGRTSRYCRPCSLRRARSRYAKKERPKRPWRAPREALVVLQAIANGESPAEAAERLKLSRDTVHDCLRRLRAGYGADTNAAAVFAALAAKDIKPARRQPLPPRNSVTRGHTRSLLRLLRGERGPLKPGSKEHERMMDDLYAWSEAHAVSVLVAAGIITAIPSMEKEAA